VGWLRYTIPGIEAEEVPDTMLAVSFCSLKGRGDDTVVLDDVVCDNDNHVCPVGVLFCSPALLGLLRLAVNRWRMLVPDRSLW
jgi:hypothetical protein